MKNKYMYMVLGILACGVLMGCVSAASVDECRLYVRVSGYVGEPEHTYSEGTNVGFQLKHKDIYDAQIYINGHLEKGLIRVPSGKVNLTVKKEGYKTHSETFIIPWGGCGSEEIITRSVELQLEGCFLDVKVNFLKDADRGVSSLSSLRVFLDGKPINTNGAFFVKKSGTHTIEARKFGFKSSEKRTFQCSSGEFVKESLDLVASPENCIPRIRVYENRILKNSKKPLMWGQLYIDGLERGWIKNKMIRLGAGKTHTIELRREGYVSDTKQFTCNKGERPTVEFTLTKQ